MNKNKEMLAIKLNLEFDEVVDLFSEETLSSMEQDDLLGGQNMFCDGAKCHNCGHCYAGCGSTSSPVDPCSPSPGPSPEPYPEPYGKC